MTWSETDTFTPPWVACIMNRTCDLSANPNGLVDRNAAPFPTN